jgi:hypothetical protein
VVIEEKRLGGGGGVGNIIGWAQKVRSTSWQGTSRREARQNQRNGTGVGRDPLDKWRRCRSRIDEPKKSSPAGFPRFGGVVEGSIKERLKDEAEEVERGWGKPEVVVIEEKRLGGGGGGVGNIILGEPKKYGVLVDREQVEEKSGRTKRNGTGVLGRDPLDKFGGDVEVEQMNLRNPVQRVSRVLVEMSKGV